MNPRIIEQLGGEKILERDIRNDNELMDAIQQGIPKAAVDYWIKDNNISMGAISSFLNMNPRTLERRKGKSLQPNEGDALAQLADLFATGKDIFGNKERFLGWMHTENAAIGYKKPFDLLSSSVGRDSVKNVLGRIDYGVYS